jgi:DNA primase
MKTARHIDNSFYRLTPAQAKAFALEGKLPRDGYATRSKPLSELAGQVAFQVWDRIARDWKPYSPRAKEGWIQRTPLTWHDGEAVKAGWVWSIHVYESP